MLFSVMEDNARQRRQGLKKNVQKVEHRQEGIPCYGFEAKASRISIFDRTHRFNCQVCYSLTVPLKQLKNCSTERECDLNSSFLEDKSLRGKANWRGILSLLHS